MSFQAYSDFRGRFWNNYDNSPFESAYDAEESKVVMSPCETASYYLTIQKSYQYIVLRLRFDWLVLFKLARLE